MSDSKDVPRLEAMNEAPILYRPSLHDHISLEGAQLYYCGQGSPSYYALRHQNVYALVSVLNRNEVQDSPEILWNARLGSQPFQLFYPREYYVDPNLAAEMMSTYEPWESKHPIESALGWHLFGYDRDGYIQSIGTIDRGVHWIRRANQEVGILLDVHRYPDKGNIPVGGTYHEGFHYYPFPFYRSRLEESHPLWTTSIARIEAMDAFFLPRSPLWDLSQVMLQRQTLKRNSSGCSPRVAVSCFGNPREEKCDWQLFGPWREDELQVLEPCLVQALSWHPGAWFASYKFTQYCQTIYYGPRRKIFFEGSSVEQLVSRMQSLFTSSGV